MRIVRLWVIALIFGILASCVSKAPTRSLILLPIIDVQKDFSYVSEAEREECIMKACADYKWRIKKREANLIEASLEFKDKHGKLHSADIRIRHSQREIRLYYLDSKNLLYTKGKTPKIHRWYNRWVNNLASRMRIYLDEKNEAARKSLKAYLTISQKEIV